MDKDFKERLIDYFDAYDLVDLLGVSTEDVVEAFEEVIEEQQDMLEDYIRHGK